LDRFIDLRATLATEEKLQSELLESQTAIEKASQQVALTPAWEQALATARNQLRALEQANATEVIRLQRKLADEIETRNQLRAKLKSIEDAVLSPAVTEEIGRLRSLGDPNGHTTPCAEMNAIMDLAGTFAGQMENSKSDAQRKFEAFHSATNEKLAGWKARDGIAAQEIEEKRKLLESQGVRLDMSFIQKLAKDEAEAAQNVKALEGWQATKTRLLVERAELMKRRWEARARVSALRVGFGIYASRTLREALSDIMVSLKYVPDAYSPTAEQLIIQAMGWRTVQVARARLLVEVLTVPKLLAASKANDKKAVTSLETAGGVKPFNSEDATLLYQKLGEPAMRSALERVNIDDLPKLTVTKMITVPGGQPRALSRSFSALSLGQQQSVLLSLMLSSESTDPLLIDQPEDNLDSEFIYSSLIPVLRRAKERRQVIIVTHNANIAVLSDAEQIAVLKATSEQAAVVSRGSIDDPITRKAACAILEGSEEAFILRSQIYGL